MMVAFIAGVFVGAMLGILIAGLLAVASGDY